MPPDRTAPKGLPKVGDTLDLAAMIDANRHDGTKIVVSQGIAFGAETYVVWVAELFAPGARKPFLRLAGRKGETPGDIFRQLAAICDQEDVEVKGERDAS